MKFTVREEIIETVNKLFVYTDDQEWDKLQEEVFTKEVFLDMSSLGLEAANTTSKEICNNWKQGFSELDAVNHLAGNHLVNILSDDTAEVFAYATATHYKASAKNGKTREFVGSYNFNVVKTNNGWRISKFKYNLKYINGNTELT